MEFVKKFLNSFYNSGRIFTIRAIAIENVSKNCILKIMKEQGGEYTDAAGKIAIKAAAAKSH